MIKILLALTFAFSTISYAQLKPLDEVLKENSSNERFISSFSSKRCAAIYLEVAKIIQEDEPKLIEPLANKASELTLFAALVDSKKTMDEISMSDVDKADKEIKTIWNIIAEASDVSYAKTGSYLSVHERDLKFCRASYPLEKSLF